ncbi:hypothetical protein VPHD479_0276 [Vibrio phage D479]
MKKLLALALCTLTFNVSAYDQSEDNVYLIVHASNTSNYRHTKYFKHPDLESCVKALSATKQIATQIASTDAVDDLLIVTVTCGGKQTQPKTK